jgi:hypothetical protein
MIGILFLLIAHCFAAEPPSWVDRPPPASGGYRYYVGRSNESLSESDAYRAATHDAMESAIRENFGVETSIELSQYESVAQSALEKRTHETSVRVRLNNFEQVDSFLLRADGQLSVYLLFRFPMTAIETEKRRLAQGEKPLEVPLNESGTMGTGSSLFVQSTPPGIEVYIDQERWGLTPVAIRGALAPGSHELRLVDPRYEDVQEPFFLVSGEAKHIAKILQGATAKLTVRTLPDNAQISIDGLAPAQHTLSSRRKKCSAKVKAGIEITVEARFRDGNRLSRTLILNKNEDREITFELPPPEPTMREPLSQETQAKSIPNSGRKNDDEDATSAPSPLQSASIWGLGLEYSGANIPQPFSQDILGVSASYEKRFWYRLGLRLKTSIDIGAGSSQAQKNSPRGTNDSTSSLSGVSWGLGVPVYLSSSSASFYLMPEYGGISYLYHSEQKATDISFVYPRSGLTLGFQDLDSHYQIYVAFFDYDWAELGHRSTICGGAVFVWER